MTVLALDYRLALEQPRTSGSGRRRCRPFDCVPRIRTRVDCFWPIRTQT
jgi:hypothetical protein